MLNLRDCACCSSMSFREVHIQVPLKLYSNHTIRTRRDLSSKAACPLPQTFYTTLAKWFLQPLDITKDTSQFILFQVLGTAVVNYL